MFERKKKRGKGREGEERKMNRKIFLHTKSSERESPFITVKNEISS